MGLWNGFFLPLQQIETSFKFDLSEVFLWSALRLGF